MRRSFPAAAASAAWAALFLALALVPDEKLLRWKYLVVEAGVAALALGWAARLALDSSARVTRTALDVPVAAYAAGALAFFALSPEPRNSELELARMLLSAGAFFAAAQAASSSPRPILRAWAAGAALAALYGVLQHNGGFGPVQVPEFPRPHSTFGNPIFLGCFLGAAMPLTAALLAESEGLETAALLGALMLQGAGLWLAQSRAGFAALLAGGVLWALLKLEGRKRLRLLAGLVLVGVGLAVQARGREWTHPLIWRDALSLWKAHPVLGCGLGRFHIEFPAYASRATRALWPEGRMIVNFAHNEYLQVLAETGVVGVALFGCVPAALLVSLWRAPGPAAEALAPALASFALFACAFASPDMRFGVSAFVAFAGAGLWAGRSAARDWAPPQEARFALAAGALAFAAGFGLLAARPYAAQRRLAAEPAFGADKASVEPQLERVEAAAAADPKSADLAEQAAYLRAKAGDYPEAERLFRKAAALAPDRPGPWNNLGNLAYLRGDQAAAIDSWERSLKAKPDQLDAHLNLAKLYYERGQLKEAAAHCESALKLDPQNPKARVLLRKMVE